MIRLSQEVPICKAKEWATHSDLDFAIATAVLKDAAYAKQLRNRPYGRELILDNAYHEEGEPLPVTDLLEAAIRCNATYVVAPDKVNDIEFTTKAYYEARFRLGRHFKLAVVMMDSKGPNAQMEREAFLHNVGTAEMLCCSFKTAKRFEHYMQSPAAQRWGRVHLLGLAELDELPRWSEHARKAGVNMSIDTGKCFKHALAGKRFDQLKSLRISPATTAKGEVSEVSKKILDTPIEAITPEVERLFTENVIILRSYLGKDTVGHEAAGSGSAFDPPRDESGSGGQQLPRDTSASGKDVRSASNPAAK